MSFEPKGKNSRIWFFLVEYVCKNQPEVITDVLTPLDIQKKEFRRAFRGYSEEEVDTFLDRITTDYEGLYRENQELKEKIMQSEQNMARYREMEDVLKNTVIMAQKNSEELRQNTEKEARLLMDRARVEADQLLREAEQEALAVLQDAERRSTEMVTVAEGRVRLILEEYHRLEREAQVFRMRFRSLLEAQIRLLDGEEAGSGAGESEGSPAEEEEQGAAPPSPNKLVS